MAPGPRLTVLQGPHCWFFFCFEFSHEDIPGEGRQRNSIGWLPALLARPGWSPQPGHAQPSGAQGAAQPAKPPQGELCALFETRHMGSPGSSLPHLSRLWDV